MQIKFAELFQQSWNFMRNQQRFSLFAVASIVILQLIVILFTSSAITDTVSTDISVQTQAMDASKILALLLPIVLLGGSNLLIHLLMILNIQSINNGSYTHFFQNINGALKAFFPIIFLHFVMALPVGLGASTLVGGGGASDMLIIAFPVMLLGFYLFIKLCLVVYVYLLEKPQKSVLETIRFTFQLSRGKMLPLILFFVITYVLPGMVSRILSVLGNNLVSVAISLILSALISVFMAIFSFRFYQVYRQAPAQN